MPGRSVVFWNLQTTRVTGEVKTIGAEVKVENQKVFAREPFVVDLEVEEPGGTCRFTLVSMHMRWTSARASIHVRGDLNAPFSGGSRRSGGSGSPRA